MCGGYFGECASDDDDEEEDERLLVCVYFRGREVVQESVCSVICGDEMRVCGCARERENEVE